MRTREIFPILWLNQVTEVHDCMIVKSKLRILQTTAEWPLPSGDRGTAWNPAWTRTLARKIAAKTVLGRRSKGKPLPKGRGGQKSSMARRAVKIFPEFRMTIEAASN
jgi:hypothetical protein